MLGLLSLLDKDLLVQVVAVVSNEHVCLLEEQHDVDSLVELLAGQVRWHYLDAKLIEGERAHVLVGAEVVGGQRGHLVKHGGEVLLDLVAHIDLLLEEVEVVHPCVLRQVEAALLHGIHLLEVRDQHLMDLVAQLLLGLSADRLNGVFREGLIDLILVVVDSCLRILQVTDVVQHI